MRSSIRRRWSFPLAKVFYLLGPSDAKWTDTIAIPTGIDTGLVELVLPAAAIAQAAQAHGQADDITVATIQRRTPENSLLVDLR
jgi:hypothetical protein